jgi:hypothetical protein
MSVRIAAAREKPITVADNPDIHPVCNGVPCRFYRLEWHWAIGLMLINSRSRLDCPSRDHVVQFQHYNITAAQLAINRKVEQREITDAMINAQPRSDFPEMFGLQRWFWTDDAARIQRFKWRRILFDMKNDDFLR